MHALPEDLRTALRLARGETVAHAACSHYPSPRGTVRTALVVTDHAVVLAEADPSGTWTCRRHARADVTGLEIDGQGIGEAVVALCRDDTVVDRIQVARLDRRDFEDAGGILAQAPWTDDTTAPAMPIDPPPVEPPSVLESEAPVFRRGEASPPPMALPPEAEPAPARPKRRRRGRPAGGEFVRVGPPDGEVVGSRFRMSPSPARPGDTVELTWDLNWPRDARVRGVRWEFDGSERTRITVSHGKSSTTYREHHRVCHWGGTLWGAAPQGFLANMADGLATLVGGGGAEMLPAGAYQWQATVRLPDSAPASFSGSHATVAYAARAWLDIPARFDHRAGGPLAVLPEHGSVRPAESHWPGAQRGLLDGLRPEILCTLRLIGGELKAGGALHGEVSCANQSGSTVRAIILRLVQREHAKARRATRTVDRTVAQLEVPGPTDAQPQPFVIHLPDRPCHYRGKYSSTRYYVQARLDVAWRLDVHTEVAVRVRGASPEDD